MTGKTGRGIPDNHVPRELETTASYKIGNMTVSIDRVFRKGSAQTLNDILIRLIREDVESP